MCFKHIINASAACRNSSNGNGGGDSDGVKPNVENIGGPMDSNWPPSSQQNVAGGSYGLDIKPFEVGKP